MNTVRDAQLPREGPSHGMEGPPGQSHTGGCGRSEENVGQDPMSIDVPSCQCSSRGPFLSGSRHLFSLPLTFSFRGEDAGPDLPAGPFPMPKPSLGLSPLLAAGPLHVGAEPGRGRRGSQMCSDLCCSRLILPTRHT